MTKIEATLLIGWYYSKTQTAKLLGIPVDTLQWHIGQGTIKTVNFPGLGHMIEVNDVRKFKQMLGRIKRGRPSIYGKVAE